MKKNQQVPKIIADKWKFSVLAWVSTFDTKINRELTAFYWNFVRIPVESKGLEKNRSVKKYINFWYHFPFKRPLSL